MPTTLSPQSVRELGEESLGAADANGNTVPNAPGTFLALANASGGALRVRIASATKCRFGRSTHYLERTVPDGALHYLPLHQTDVDPQMRRRFGDGVQVTYPDGVVGLTVAVARLIGWLGIGADDETPVALGASPGEIPIFSKDETVDPIDASDDGMVLKRNDGRLVVWIDNAGPAARTVYLVAARPCDYGIRDDEVIVIDVGERWISRTMPVGRFGQTVEITYDAPDGLAFAAVLEEAYRG